MCVVSAILDYERDRFQKKFQEWIPSTPYSPVIPLPSPPQPIPLSELEEVKKELLALRKLLESAKEFDTVTGQPDCELESKKKLLQDMADRLGITITFD